MISIKQINIDKAKKDWEYLNNNNRSVTPFQEYELSHTIYKHYLFFKLAKKEFPIIYAFYKNDEIIMIAPLCKRYNNSNIKYVSFGAAATIAFQDFIYSDSITKSEIAECIQILLKKIGAFKIENLSENSRLFEVLNTAEPLKTHVNISLPLNDGYENYYNSLSKHTKQNIRTAYNRMKSDELSFKVETIIGGGIKKEELKKLMDIYIDRRRSRYRSTSLLHEWFLRHYHFNTIALSEQKNSIYIILKINDKIASFLGGYVTRDNQSILVPRLAIDDNFQRYSPGVVLINECMKIIERMGIKYLDLSKGEDKYKLTMGGQIYYTYDFCITDTND